MNELPFYPSGYRARWLACFDLLGTRRLIESAGYIEVFTVYERAIREAKHRAVNLPAIRFAWFSDTFLLYAENDSRSAFAEVDSVSRWFVYFLIQAEIPVRGAIACGDFYADADNQVYFGKALVEAYEHGEAQDWIGFILCPSAVNRLEELKLPAKERLNYVEADIPSKKDSGAKKGFASLLGEWCRINGENQTLQTLRRMKARQSDDSVTRKYDNAIDFLAKNTRSTSRNERE